MPMPRIMMRIILTCFLLYVSFSSWSVNAFFCPSPSMHIPSARWSSSAPTEVKHLDEKQLEFCTAYLNEHHKSDVLIPFARAFSELGATAVKRNMWMGGSYSIVDAEVTDITSDALHIEATVKEGQETKKEKISISLDSDPVSGMEKTYPTLPQIDPFKLSHASKLPIDSFCRKMIRLCNIVKAYEATGKMIQMGVQLGGKGVGKLHDDMYLNQVPHSELSCTLCLMPMPQ